MTAAGRLRSGEIIAGISSVALLVFLFGLTWYGGAPSRTGWQAVPALRWVILVAAAVGLALTVAQAVCRAPALPSSLDVVGLVLGVAVTVLLAIRLATTGAPLRAGAFLALAAAVGLTVGAYRALRREEGWTPGPNRPVRVVALGSREGR